ncbi:MAG: tRNA (adenosine(37)-N6)-threonylcarbamoyltransferase complex transferase subunit TsaD [Acidobacteria bacterium]|nr:tRNA (adenosine(37)-N6)-threonylcarbamoyltransferase complex transferase subunit TsaD [Acidobacteriota bacterium]MCI0568242.1 tRNA (adenosine(37)-N6)-threonylcarbamoyltransferase complex transferase subunit TsaD [Acidobacteriota bacterium]
MLILGIETSCDETAAAVLRDGKILSNVVSSQAKIHEKYGGVVPELASRHHVENIDIVLDLALKEASVKLSDLEAVAVTQGPGLVGSLLVGISVAKSLSYVLGIPFTGVNHLEGHVRSPFLENPDLPLPAVCLVASGGHTSLYVVRQDGSCACVARTRDDAAGEAFDKVAKLMGLGYPGGPVIDRLAREGNPDAVRLPKARMTDGTLDFSFSGLKTAVLRYVRENSMPENAYPAPPPDARVKDLLASFQKAAVDYLKENTLRVARRERVPTLCLAGGVACNTRLRAELSEIAARENWRFHAVSPSLALDNAAMIAFAGSRKLARGEADDLALNADPNLAF